MNKSLSGKDLFIVGGCLLILSGLVASIGGVATLVAAPFSVVGLVCMIAAPFTAMKKSNESSEANHERTWGDLE